MNRLVKAFMSGLFVLAIFIAIKASLYYFGYLGGALALGVIVLLINYFNKE